MAARNLGTLTVDVVAKVGGLVEGMSRGERSMKSFAIQAEKVGKVVGAVGVAAAAAFAAMAKISIDNADRLAKLSQSVGIATEALSELEYAANSSGTSSEELTGALNRLNRSVAQAAGGAKAPAEAYERLGVSVTDAAGRVKDAETLLTEVAEAFAGLEEGPEKAALAMEIFGNAGASLLPFLNNGKAGIQALREEARAFGVTVDSEAAAAAERFNDNLTRLRTALEGVTNQLVQAMLPAFDEMSAAAVRFSQDTQALKILMNAVATVFETIVVLGINVAYVFEQIALDIEAMGRQLNALRQFDLDGFLEIRRERIADAERARKAIDELSESILTARDRAAQGIMGPPISAMNRPGRAITPTPDGGSGRDRPSELERMIAALKLQGATLGMTSEQIEIYRLKQAGASESQIAYARSIQEANRWIEEQQNLFREGQALTQALLTPTERLFEQEAQYAELLRAGAINRETYNRAIEQSRKAYEDTLPSVIQARQEQERLNQLLAATPSEQFEKMAADMRLLDAAFYAGKITADQYFEALQTHFGEFSDSAKKATDIMTVFADQAARNMQTAFADFLFDPFDGGLKGMVRGFSEALRRMASEALASQLFKMLGQSMAGGSGFWAQLGTAFLAGARADGGPVAGGKTYLVGERGPELFVPNTSGKILPNGMAEAAGAGASGPNIRIVNAFDNQVIGDYMGSAAGERVIMNAVRRHKSEMAMLMGGR